jgi:hypothetical protein
MFLFQKCDLEKVRDSSFVSELLEEKTTESEVPMVVMRTGQLQEQHNQAHPHI